MMRPMSEAPRDRTFILALYRPPQDHRQARFSGRWFSVFHEGKTLGNFDMGWSLHPGYGGVPDDHFAGWLPCPDPDAKPTPPERANALEEADIERIAVGVSDKVIIRLDVHEENLVLSGIIDELRNDLRALSASPTEVADATPPR